MFQKWSLRDVILLALLAILFGGIFVGSSFLYNILSAVLAPIGLEPFANEILFGLWCMAAPMAAMLLRKPGSATIGELLAALAEVLYGSQFGMSTLISGFIQGFGSELGFAATRYKRYDWLSLTYSAIGTTLLSFTYEYFKIGYYAFKPGFVLALLVVRFLSVFFFCAVLVKTIMNLYDKINQAAGK
ncbi:ECF transporter S component [Streptococcus constellatus]|uniref:Cobalt ABC transporter, permease protein n=1 Tax=Streptococcus constellatus subsp. constellatus SK53 TaxID=1095730 RepID=A0AAD2Y4T6_STRCV|nr:ECF transporter S component [Streptococcus constellatus]EID21385.1 cobalt ABC transporter, permease protein [Streptococcus constellatus subsp. constellatus SK53]MDP1485960.1 ECF transporter S component [Streptococcus constellatus]QQT05387.1 ECF transporter S component [Streptococcus constellatus]SUN39905.1 ABC transporter permease [Streptococcus constellatus]BBD21959.1 hypothetical protein SCSC_0273 [Streptococcus constellatus subsp. constellatus]